MPSEHIKTKHRDSLISQYRLLDLQVGQIITLLEIHHELLAQRRSQVKLREIGLEGGLAVSLGALLAGVPAVYSLAPDKPWLSGVVGLIALAYIVRLISQFAGHSKERRDLRELLPDDHEEPLECQPYFLLTKISGRGTLLSVATEVLRCEFPQGDGTKAKFEANVKYLRDTLAGDRDEAERLNKAKRLSEAEFQEVKEWVRRALSQPPEPD